MARTRKTDKSPRSKSKSFAIFDDEEQPATSPIAAAAPSAANPLSSVRRERADSGSIALV